MAIQSLNWTRTMGNEKRSYDEVEIFIQRGIEINKRLSEERAKPSYSSQDKIIEMLELERKNYEQKLKLYIKKTANQ